MLGVCVYEYMIGVYLPACVGDQAGFCFVMFG